jgi:hypothetical protein
MEKKIYSKPETHQIDVAFQGIIANSFSISSQTTDADACMTQKQDAWSSDSWQ